MKKLNNEQRKLAEENFGLIDEFFRKNPSFDREEYWGIAAITLCEACRTFNEEKSSFKTYAFNCIRNRILNNINMFKLGKRDGGDIFSIDEVIVSEKDSKRESSYDKPSVSKFSNDPQFHVAVLDIMKNAGMTKVEKVVFLKELDLADYTDTVKALSSGHYSKYRTDMQRKLKNFYFPCEKTA